MFHIFLGRMQIQPMFAELSQLLRKGGPTVLLTLLDRAVQVRDA
jgi:hypothetical protein